MNWREDCLKNFCEPFIEHAEDSIDSGMKKMLLLLKKSLNHIKMQQNVKIVEKTITFFSKDKNHLKVRNHCHYRGK